MSDGPYYAAPGAVWPYWRVYKPIRKGSRKVVFVSSHGNEDLARIRAHELNEEWARKQTPKGAK